MQGDKRSVCEVATDFGLDLLNEKKKDGDAGLTHAIPPKKGTSADDPQASRSEVEPADPTNPGEGVGPESGPMETEDSNWPKNLAAAESDPYYKEVIAVLKSSGMTIFNMTGGAQRGVPYFTGMVHGKKIQLKIWEGPSQYGVSKGPISGAWAFDKENEKVILNYDRGWDKLKDGQDPKLKKWVQEVDQKLKNIPVQKSESSDSPEQVLRELKNIPVQKADKPTIAEQFFTHLRGEPLTEGVAITSDEMKKVAAEFAKLTGLRAEASKSYSDFIANIRAYSPKGGYEIGAWQLANHLGKFEAHSGYGAFDENGFGTFFPAIKKAVAVLKG